MIAKTDKGKIIPLGKREYKEIGLDLDGFQRMGAWQIKEIVDFSLQPTKSLKERFIGDLPEETESAEIEIKVSYWPDAKTEWVVHRAVKKIGFEPRR